jgi:hypothetical protein
MSSNLTPAEARDDILTMVNTGWTAVGSASENLPLLFWNSKQQVPKTNDANGNPTSWGRVNVAHVTGGQGALRGSPEGLPNTTPWTRQGLVTVQVFTPLGTGLSIADSLYKIVLDVFEGRKSPLGVWFRETRLNEIGPSGGWFQANILAEFEYDEIK